MHHPFHLHYSSYDTNVVSLYHRDILLLNTLKLNYIYQIIIIYMIYTEFFIIIDKYYTIISNFFLHCKMNFFQKSFPLIYISIYFIRIIFTISKTYLSANILASNHCRINELCHDQKFKYSIG